MSEQKPLTGEEKRLLSEFNSLQTTEDRIKWIESNKRLFQADEVYRDKEVLHSGWNGANREEAEAFAKREGGIILEQLPGGGILEHAKFNKGNRADVDRVWGKASEIYANSLQGNVHIFAHKADPNRILAQRELPVLVDPQNNKVTHINGKNIQLVREIWGDTENKSLAASRVIEATDRTQLIEYKTKLIGWDGEKQQTKKIKQENNAQTKPENQKPSGKPAAEKHKVKSAPDLKTNDRTVLKQRFSKVASEAANLNKAAEAGAAAAKKTTQITFTAGEQALKTTAKIASAAGDQALKAVAKVASAPIKVAEKVSTVVSQVSTTVKMGKVLVQGIKEELQWKNQKHVFDVRLGVKKYEASIKAGSREEAEAKLKLLLRNKEFVKELKTQKDPKRIAARAEEIINNGNKENERSVVQKQTQPSPPPPPHQDQKLER